jgi:hypothetical protein
MAVAAVEITSLLPVVIVSMEITVVQVAVVV